MGSISGVGQTADRKGPLSVVGYGLNTFSSESQFLEKLSIIECHIKRMGSVPKKKFVPSQHLRQLKTYHTEKPFLSDV